MEQAMALMPSRSGRLEALVHEIMKIFHLSQAEAATIAFSILMRELIIAMNTAQLVAETA